MKKLLLSGFCLLIHAYSLSGQVQFEEVPFTDLIQRAGIEDKLVFVDAYTDWCGWCKTMDQETFANSAVGSYMNNRFLSTKLNMEEGFGLNMAMKHRVSQYPHYLIFDGQGNLLARISGFLAPKPFIDQLDKAVFQNPPLPAQRDPLNFDIDYPDFYKNSFKKNKERSYPSAEEVESWLATRDDLTEEVSWSVVHRFVGGGTYALKIADLKDELIEKYGREEVISKLASLIFNDVKLAIKSRDEQVLENALNASSTHLGEDAADYNLRFKLYFFQMTSNWDAYCDVIDQELEQEPLKRPDAVIQAASNIESIGTNGPEVARAAQWMQTLMARNPSYEHSLLYAKLLLKMEENDKARSELRLGLKLAGEDTDTEEAMKLLEQIP